MLYIQAELPGIVRGKLETLKFFLNLKKIEF